MAKAWQDFDFTNRDIPDVKQEFIVTTQSILEKMEKSHLHDKEKEILQKSVEKVIKQ